MTREDEQLTTAEAARVVGVHPQTMRGYEKAGIIRATRTPGGARRFRLGDVEVLRDGGNPLAARSEEATS